MDDSGDDATPGESGLHLAVGGVLAVVGDSTFQFAAAVALAVVLAIGGVVGLVIFVKRRKASRVPEKEPPKKAQRPSFNLKPKPSGPSTPPRCAGCGMLGSEAASEGRILEGCARCKACYFCCRPCQKAAWKWHKSECKPVEDVITPGKATDISEAADDQPGSAVKRGSLGKKDIDSTVALSKAMACLQEAAAALAGGEVKRSKAKAEESWKFAKKAKDTTELQGEALSLLGQACLHLGDTTAADQAYTSMVDIGREAGSASVEGQGLVGRGQSASRQKNMEAKAVVFHESAIKLAKGASEEYSDDVIAMEIAARGSRGRCLSALGKLGEAAGELQQVVSLRRLGAAASENPEPKRRLGYALVDHASMVGGMAANEAGTGGKQAALPILREALAVAKDAGDARLQQVVKANLQSLGGEADGASVASGGASKKQQ